MTLPNYGILPKILVPPTVSPYCVDETSNGYHRQRLPDDIIGKIALFAGFREIFILDCFLPKLFDEKYIQEVSSPSLESSVDRGCIYEVIYRLWKDPQPVFRRTIILARALRMQRWEMARSMTIIFKTKANLWDIFAGVKNGMDAKTLEILLCSYPEFKLERIRTALIAQSEITNNPDIFLYVLKETNQRWRRKNQIRKLLEMIEEDKRDKVEYHANWKMRLVSLLI